LEARLPAESTRPAALHQAMRYSVLAGGKRLRPILCLAAAEAVGGDPARALLPALALEALHTYTLIHDDLPAMDNDTLRRGKPTCHVVFGEATAILAGDALLTLAFEWLAQTQAPPPYPPNQFALELAGAAGSQGVIGGQVEDLAAEGRPASAELVEYIHCHKTAALLRASVRMGAIAAGAAAADLEALSSYGLKVGLAFQIVDDILNETSSASALGKAAQTDRQRRKMTYVAAHGLEAAHKRAHELAAEAGAAVRTLGQPAEPLRALAEFICARKH
jgi:geranylgeranyl diphosphate synthase type II